MRTGTTLKMTGKNGKPSWWLCYLIWALMIALFVVNYGLPLPDGWHTAGAIATIAGCYGLIASWLRANRAALALEDFQKEVRRREGRARDVPLSRVQAKYLQAVDRRKP